MFFERATKSVPGIGPPPCLRQMALGRPKPWFDYYQFPGAPTRPWADGPANSSHPAGGGWFKMRSWSYQAGDGILMSSFQLLGVQACSVLQFDQFQITCFQSMGCSNTLSTTHVDPNNRHTKWKMHTNFKCYWISTIDLENARSR